MRVLFVGDVMVGRPILEAIGTVGTLAGAAVEGDRHRDAAAALGVPVLEAREVNASETLARLAGLELDLIVNFNSTILFSADLLGLPRVGAINFHPGLLPDYAGLNVHQWAILNDETETGCTVHVMTPHLDAGPILARSRVEILETDTGLTLFMKLLRSGVDTMTAVLTRVAETGFDGAEAQPGGFTHFYRRADRPDGRIDFTRTGAEISRLIRALSYRPMASPLDSAWFQASGAIVEVAKFEVIRASGTPRSRPAEIQSVEPERITVACTDGAVAIETVYLDGERMSGSDAAARLGLEAGAVL